MVQITVTGTPILLGIIQNMIFRFQKLFENGVILQRAAYEKGPVLPKTSLCIIRGKPSSLA